MEILIAEDSLIAQLALEATLLKWDYDVVVTRDGGEAWEALRREDAPQLVILDWMMPNMDGPEVCRRLRAQNREPYTYVIMLTAKDEKADVIQGLEAGADDYIAKPFDLDELRVRLRTGRRIVELQRELIDAREALRVQATHDLLTGVWNRAAIMEALEREVARSTREEAPLAVMMADLDHFKTINDTYGHGAGDAVLCEAVRRMRSSLRPYDEMGRYGGEEFLVLLPGATAMSALGIGERLRSRIAQDSIKTPDVEVSVTVSLGVAGSRLDGSTDADSLVRAADRALYRAKELGRNRVAASIAGGPSAGLAVA